MAEFKSIILNRQEYLDHSEPGIVMLWAAVETAFKKSVRLLDKNPPTRN